MDYQEILKILSPCGLNCQKCMFSVKGDIKQHSTALKELLGSFDRYAQRFSSFLPVFENYPQFKELLIFFTEANCEGYRSGRCNYPNCGVMKCFIEKRGGYFCFQGDVFPGEKTNFDPDLKRRWIEMNTRMRKIVVEAYYEETKDMCR